MDSYVVFIRPGRGAGGGGGAGRGAVLPYYISHIYRVCADGTDNQVFLLYKATEGMALKPALRYVPCIHRIQRRILDPNLFSFVDFQKVNQMTEEELIKPLNH